jgi:hypothetical protein
METTYTPDSPFPGFSPKELAELRIEYQTHKKQRWAWGQYYQHYPLLEEFMKRPPGEEQWGTLCYALGKVRGTFSCVQEGNPLTIVLSFTNPLPPDELEPLLRTQRGEVYKLHPRYGCWLIANEGEPPLIATREGEGAIKISQAAPSWEQVGLALLTEWQKGGESASKAGALLRDMISEGAEQEGEGAGAAFDQACAVSPKGEQVIIAKKVLVYGQEFFTVLPSGAFIGDRILFSHPFPPNWFHPDENMHWELIRALKGGRTEWRQHCAAERWGTKEEEVRVFYTPRHLCPQRALEEALRAERPPHDIPLD